MSEDLPSGPCITFDIGGTSIRAALYDPTSQDIGEIAHRATPSHHLKPECSEDERSEHLFSTMDELIRLLCGADAPSIMGCAFPGPIDPEGNVLSVPTVFGRSSRGPRPIGREFSARWPRTEIILLNDVTAAGYYYLQHPRESFCVTTVSSGIGNKIFIDGVPIVGPVGRGGEIGHVVVDPSPDAAPCDCGGRGHLGGIASGRGALAAFVRAARSDQDGFSRSWLGKSGVDDVDQLTTEHIVAAYHAGDAWASSQLQRVTEPLARVLATIHGAIGIERFVMIGGFALALGDRYIELLAELCSQNCWNLGQYWKQMLELGTAGDRAGLVGAGHAAMQHLESRRCK